MTAASVAAAAATGASAAGSGTAGADSGAEGLTGVAGPICLVSTATTGAWRSGCNGWEPGGDAAGTFAAGGWGACEDAPQPILVPATAGVLQVNLLQALPNCLLYMY